MVASGPGRDRRDGEPDGLTTGLAVDITEASPGLGETGRRQTVRWRGVWRPVVVVVAVVVVTAWLWLLYQLSWRIGYTADDANALLAGRDLIGNPLLRGWVLPGDPFWLTYGPVFAVVGWLLGAGPSALRAGPVLVVGGIVAAGWWLVDRGEARHSAGWWIGAALVTLLLGLPPRLMAQFLFAAGHVATALECLVGAALLLHSPRRPTWWAGILLLAAAVVSDPFGVTIGVLPVVCAGAAAALRRRRWAPLAMSTCAATLAGAAALIARVGLRAAGGFGLAPALPLAPSSYRLDNLRALPGVLAPVLGIGRAGGLSGFAAAARAIGVALLVLGVAVAAVRLVSAVIHGPGQPGNRPAPESAAIASGWMDDVLLAGIVGGLATFVVATLPPRDLASARYLTTALIYGAVLAGRQLAWVANRLPARGRALVGVALVPLAIGFVLTPLATIRVPDATNAGRDLVPWLSANGLRAGYGSYWTASIVTVESGGSIPVRPVISVDGRLRGYLYYSTRRWFREDRPPAGRWFVVYDAAHPGWGVDDQTARATFGPPATTVKRGSYRILIWDNGLSPELGPPYRDPERALGVVPDPRPVVGRLAA
jgi:hypothetical protein